MYPLQTRSSRVAPRDTRFIAAIESYVGHQLNRAVLPTIEQVEKAQLTFEETMHKPLERQAKKGEICLALK